jgi:hypothetical protein
MNQTNSSILAVLVNRTLFFQNEIISSSYSSSFSTTTLETTQKYSSFLVTTVTNGFLILLFSICLFPLIYCYKRIHQKLLNIGFISNVRPSSFDTSRHISSISFSVNDLTNRNITDESTNDNKQMVLPPMYEKIEKIANIDGLPTYENYVKSKFISSRKNF